ncbi:MAG: hypothetical protein ACKV0T_27140 [Planctomycetales bacterium]
MKRKSKDQSLWPTFDSPLLQGVASAFLRRRKTLNYQVGLACEKEFSETESGALERLNLNLFPGNGGLQLSVWEDGGMWLQYCVKAPGRNSGWAYSDHFYGSLDDVSPETLVAIIERTIARRFDPENSDPTEYRKRLREIWGRVQPFEE